MKSLIIVLACCTTTACANFYPPSRIATLKPNTQYWVSYDASRRGAWLSTDAAGRSVTSCAEPAPDVALSLATTLKGKGSVPSGASAEAEFSATATALALAGRDNVVLLAREAMFRICEEAAAGKIDRTAIVPLFLKIIEQTQAIAIAQAEKSKQDTKRATIDAIKKAPDPETAKALLMSIQ